MTIRRGTTLFWKKFKISRKLTGLGILLILPIILMPLVVFAFVYGSIYLFLLFVLVNLMMIIGTAEFVRKEYFDMK